MDKESSIHIDLSKPTTTAPIQDILKEYGISRAIACSKFGNYPIFIAHEISKALGQKPARKVNEVSTINLEVEYGGPDLAHLADAFYSWAQGLVPLVEARDYVLTVGELDGTKVASLIYRGTGMAIPFFIKPE